MNDKIAIYSLFVKQSMQITKLRTFINLFFIMLNVFFPENNSLEDLVKIFLLNLIWYFLIISYKKLNQAKFDVILKMEDFFDFKPFSEEWEFIKKNGRIDFTKIEILIPVFFMLNCFFNLMT